MRYLFQQKYAVLVLFLYFWLYANMWCELPERGNYSIILTSRNVGLFSVLDDVLDLVKRYEMGCYRSIEVDFNTGGLYYEANHGKNWWSYYFEPLSVGQRINVKICEGGPPYSFDGGWKILRSEAFSLIQKYFHLKPCILKKINEFEKKFNDHFVISVHYRGTDKTQEAPYIPYQRVEEEILKVMKVYGDLNYKIFLATDDQNFLNFMKRNFGDILCFNKKAYRSENGCPVHINSLLNHYKCGEDAIIDCILLSKGNFLIKSNSNLSRWATFFNPKIPFKELNISFYSTVVAIDDPMPTSKQKEVEKK